MMNAWWALDAPNRLGMGCRDEADRAKETTSTKWAYHPARPFPFLEQRDDRQHRGTIIISDGQPEVQIKHIFR